MPTVEQPTTEGEMLATAVARNKRQRAPKPPQPELPAWFQNPMLKHTDTIEVGAYPLLLATPLETIAALLLADDTEIETPFTGEQRVQIKTIPHPKVFRIAVLALRLERADVAAIAEHRRLQAEIDQLKTKLEEVGEKLPREVRRGW